MPNDSFSTSSPQIPANSQAAPRVKAVRSWIMGALFLWALIGAVAFAAYSSLATPAPTSQLAMSPAPENGGPNGASNGAPPSEIPVNGAASSTDNSDTGDKSTGVRWEKDFESAMQRARIENKPIMVDFYTDWCGVCKIFDRDVLPDPRVISESRNWIAVKINAEKRPDVAGAYGVTGYPTIVFAAKSGKPLSILPGMAEAPEFVKIMQEARAKI